MVDHDLKHRIAWIRMGDSPDADNLAVAICTYFSNHPERPENDPDDDETGWGEWVNQQYERTMTRIMAASREGT
jgi:hypothetical protein